MVVGELFALDLLLDALLPRSFLKEATLAMDLLNFFINGLFN